MTSEWRTTTLREVGVELLDCDHRTPPAVDDGVPYVGIPQLQDGRVNLAGARTISRDDFIEWTRKTLPKHGDIILSRRCNPGETAVVPANAEFALGQNLVLLRADGKSSHPGFLRWAVRSPIWWEQIGKFINVGAVFESLRCKDILKFSLPFPSIDIQEQVSQVLDAIDSRIELSISQNESLEATARAIFKSWFVDFDPVRAKAEGREPEGMDAATAALFPSEFTGDVPLGWRRVPLDSVAIFLNGLALQKYPARSEDNWIPAIKIAQLRKGSAEGADRISKNVPAQYRIVDGDLLFSWSGSLEVDRWCGGVGALNQHLFKVTSDFYPMWFVSFWLREHLAHFREIAESKVTTMGHIQRHHLKEALVTIAPAETLSGLSQILSPLFEKVYTGRLQMRTLAEIRDTLLPRLISGQLRVPEAEKLVEAAL